MVILESLERVAVADRTAGFPDYPGWLVRELRSRAANLGWPELEDMSDAQWAGLLDTCGGKSSRGGELPEGWRDDVAKAVGRER